ncbi:MAG: tellurite resistance TerB family protein [Rhizobiales bacterium]|nr:tellurite resistance TerB family protein [Hyphomicrobiales bacterium]
MNPQALLEQFLGPQAAQKASGAAQSAKNSMANSGLGGVAGGLAAGGLLGVLLGNKKARKKVGKLAGGVVGYGGAAALGALAYRAYQNWETNQPVPEAAPAAATSVPQTGVPAGYLPPPPAESKFNVEAAPAKDGKPFELALVLAMISAANADGHIDSDEQSQIFDRVGALPLDAEAKGFVFDALSKPPSLQDIADLAEGTEQAAELYLASRLAIDPDHPMEQAYLEALGSRLGLPGDLVEHLNGQAATLDA